MIATITSCRRPELFARTVKSFAENARDWHAIIDSLCIFDDASDEDAIVQMRQSVFESNLTIGSGNWNTRGMPEGHWRMMNDIRRTVCEIDDYKAWAWLHLEDDFEIVRSGCPILAALDVLLNEPRVCQCCLGRSEHYTAALEKEPRCTPTGTRYALMPEYPNPENWVGFTLNPSVMRVQAFREVGEFREGQMEHNYGVRLAEKGWRTAHLTPHWLRHIGDGHSAYDLTGAKR